MLQKYIYIYIYIYIYSLSSFSERSGLAPSLIKCFFISNTDSLQMSQNIELTDPKHQEKANNEAPPRKEPSKVSTLFNDKIDNK